MFQKRKKNYTKRFLITASVFILLIIANFYPKKHIDIVEKKIKTMSSREIKYLKYAINHSLSYSPFAYTLFGEKPMSFDGYLESTFIESTYKNQKNKRAALKEHRKLQKGWEVWEKYSHLFPSKNYILKKHENPSMSLFVDIILINKKAFVEIVETYRADFEKVLGKNFNGQEILIDFEQGQGVLLEKILAHDGLLGTVLGFGRNNAWNFHRRTELKKLTQINTSLEQELAYLTKKLKPFNDELKFLPRFMYLPFFVADIESEETKKLKEKYIEDKKKTWKIYKKFNFLEAILFQLMQE